jgi:hypothetical protein
MTEKIIIFNKKYSVRSLKRIKNGWKDNVIEFLTEDLDYICDCSLVKFFVCYRWRFKNKDDGKIVDVYLDYYPDTKEYEFVDGQDSIYYIKKKEDEK